MDQHQKTIMELRIRKTMKNLEQHNMQPFYAHDRAQAVEIVRSLLQKGDVVTAGGTMTMEESGLKKLLTNGDYRFLDRNRPGITQEEIDEIYHQAFSADAYIASSNAVTENGELFNVDGNSNRVAAILYGPKSVIMVVGYNKIVADLDEAILRVKKVAAPASTVTFTAAQQASVFPVRRATAVHSLPDVIRWGVSAATMWFLPCSGRKTASRSSWLEKNWGIKIEAKINGLPYKMKKALCH